MDGQYRQQLEKFIGIEKPPTFVVSTFDSAEFVVTRVQWQSSGDGHLTRFGRTNGYMLCVQRRDLAAQPYWVDGQATSLTAMTRGQFLLLDLNIEHSSLVPSDVDCISVLTSHETLKRFQEEHDLPVTGLRTPLGAAHDDHVIGHLCEALLPAIEKPQEANQLWVDHIALAMLARLTSQHGTQKVPAAPLPGGLAPWQERRAKEAMMAHLDGRVGLVALAAECRLSRSHFARAFKVSTGLSPLRWLHAQRIERAKALLTSTDLPLEQIVGFCGFSDSSHLSRSFQQATGVTPGAWRRLRCF
jgi:AraC family transcriptional regulator